MYNDEASNEAYELSKYNLIVSQRRKQKIKKNYSIALLAPANNGVISEIKRGVIETLNLYSPLRFHYTTFISSGCSNRAQKHAQSITKSQSFDALLTVGMHCTKAAINATKSRPTLPIIFGDVENTLECGIDPLKRLSSDNSTGITSLSHGKHEEQLKILLELQPATKRVLLPYKPGCCNIENELTSLFSIARDNNVSLKLITFQKKEDLISRLSQSLHKDHDVIILPRDWTAISSIPEIAHVCNKLEATLITSDIYSILQGASAGFGPSEYSTGKLMGERVRMIFEDEITPASIPLERAYSQYIFRINSAITSQQGFSLDPALSSTLSNLEIV